VPRLRQQRRPTSANAPDSHTNGARLFLITQFPPVGRLRGAKAAPCPTRHDALQSTFRLVGNNAACRRPDDAHLKRRRGAATASPGSRSRGVRCTVLGQQRPKAGVHECNNYNDDATSQALRMLIARSGRRRIGGSRTAQRIGNRCVRRTQVILARQTGRWARPAAPSQPSSRHLIRASLRNDSE